MSETGRRLLQRLRSAGYTPSRVLAAAAVVHTAQFVPYWVSRARGQQQHSQTVYMFPLGRMKFTYHEVIIPK